MTIAELEKALTEARARETVDARNQKLERFRDRVCGETIRSIYPQGVTLVQFGDKAKISRDGEKVLIRVRRLALTRHDWRGGVNIESSDQEDQFDDATNAIDGYTGRQRITREEFEVRWAEHGDRTHQLAEEWASPWVPPADTTHRKLIITPK